MGRSAVAPMPWSVPNNGTRARRLPRIPGRAPVISLLAAGLILDMMWHQMDPHNEVGEDTRPLPNLAGWNHTCGPFAHPGSDYFFQIAWQAFIPEAGSCNVPQPDQAGFDNLGIDPLAKTLYLGYGPKVANPARYYAYDQYTRSTAGTIVPLQVRSVNPPMAVVLTGFGSSVAPLTPSVVRPWPIRLVRFLPTSPFPEAPRRGYTLISYSSGAVAAPDRPYRDRVVRFVYVGPDVAQPPTNPEQKTDPTSRAGQALTQAFRLLSLYGTSEAFINALWKALPAHLRTRHARNADKLRDLGEHWGDIDMGEAFTNSLQTAVNTALAGIMFGQATEALTKAFGEGPGFGLYRAWSTGEFAYRTSTNSYDPVRVGGDVAAGRAPNPWGPGASTSFDRRKAKERLTAEVRRARRARARHNRQWHESAAERRMNKLLRAMRRRRRLATRLHRTRTKRRHLRIHS